MIKALKRLPISPVTDYALVRHVLENGSIKIQGSTLAFMVRRYADDPQICDLYEQFWLNKLDAKTNRSSASYKGMLVIAREAMKSYQDAIDSFDFTQRVQELLTLKSFDSESCERKLLVRYANVCEAFELVRSERHYILGHWQMLTDRHGPTPNRPDSVDRFGYAFYLIPMLYDASLLSAYFVSDGYGLVSAYCMAIALSVGIGTACHHGGKAIVNRKPLPAAVCYGLVLALAGVIFGMRSGVDNAILNVAVMILLNGIGSLITYRNISRKLRFEAREMFNRVDARYHDLLKEKTDLEKQLNNPSALAEDQAKREATEELSELEAHRDQHQYSIVYLENRIDEIQTKNNDIKQWGVNRMRLAQAKGARKKGGVLLQGMRTIILFLFTTITMLIAGCSGDPASRTDEPISIEAVSSVNEPEIGEVTYIDVYIDKSKSMTPIDEKQVQGVKNYLHTLADLGNPSSMKRHGAIINIKVIGSKIVASQTTIELSVPAHIAFRNVPERKREMDSIGNLIDVTLDSIIHSPSGDGWTNISEAVGHGLHQMVKAPATRRITIILSDFLQSNPELDLSGMTAPEIEDIASAVDSILMAKTPLPDLIGCEMLLIALSLDDFDSPVCQLTGKHTNDCYRSNGAEVYAASNIFKRMYARADADDVTIKGSL
ncbi:MAG: hypothetical protein JJ975_05855 [Bacteroidia bacterium]|nr:hypothetical protein [Bacteroidia bacterium]